MKRLFIAGNWKSNKTISEAKEWFKKFTVHSSQFQDITIVICAPFIALSSMHQLPHGVGAQNVSAFPEGAYTGEVTARQIREVADWVIIGHSERRKYFGETDEILSEKVVQAHAAGLRIIYCVPDNVTTVPAGVEVVAYEPVWAIGTGKTDTPENAGMVISEIKQKTGAKTVIYGGSVTADNVASFVRQPEIDGVLAGGVSLDPEKFSQLLYEAKKYT